MAIFVKSSKIPTPQLYFTWLLFINNNFDRSCSCFNTKYREILTACYYCPAAQEKQHCPIYTSPRFSNFRTVSEFQFTHWKNWQKWNWVKSFPVYNTLKSIQSHNDLVFQYVWSKFKSVQGGSNLQHMCNYHIKCESYWMLQVYVAIMQTTNPLASSLQFMNNFSIL